VGDGSEGRRLPPIGLGVLYGAWLAAGMAGEVAERPGSGVAGRFWAVGDPGLLGGSELSLVRLAGQV